MKRSSASTSTRRLSSVRRSSLVSSWRKAPGLDVLAQPHALAVRGDVLDLVGDRAAVGLAQVRQRVGERRARARTSGRCFAGIRAWISGVRPSASGSRPGSPSGSEPSGSRRAARWPWLRTRLTKVRRRLHRLQQLLAGRAPPAPAARSRRPPRAAGRGQRRRRARARRRATRRRPRRSRARPAGSSSISARKRPDSAPWMMRWS